MYRAYFSPFPKLDTGRLLLRRMEKWDLQDLYACYSEPAASRYAVWKPHPDLYYTKSYMQYVIRGYARQESMVFCIELKEQHRVIGTCSFTEMDEAYKIAEIGYTLSPAYWRCGYGTEAVAALVRFGFETIGLCRISARVMAENRASARLLRRLGFRQEGYLADGIYCKGALRDLCLFGLLQSEYRSRKEHGENQELSSQS